MIWTPRTSATDVEVYPSKARTAGLVYVRSRRTARACPMAGQLGFTTASYHAGLSPDERRSIEATWLKMRA